VRNEDEETGPNRTCVATRSILPANRLIRFVLDGEGVLTPDLKGKLPGRGAWVRASHQTLEDAVRRKCFARSLKRPVTVPDGLLERVELLLSAEVRQALAMANKAGLVITGFAKVEAALAKRNTIALVFASDGGADGKRKLAQAVMRNNGSLEAVPFVSPFKSDEMDLALGRENAIHAALQAGSASDAFLMKCQRLDEYRHGASDVKGPDAGESPALSGQFVLDGAEAVQNGAVDADVGQPTE
jgi:uncharacterized protein